MHDPTPVASQRLKRLQAYLLEDPANGELLAELYELALQEGAHGCAGACIASARKLNLSPLQWTHRAAYLAMAQGQWPRALDELLRLRTEGGDGPALAHDIALAHLQMGDAGRSRSELAPWLDRIDDAGDAAHAALHVLWLRATHRCGLPAEAASWSSARADRGLLPPLAAGVASLAAVDASDFPLAKRLSEQALRAGAASAEAFVACATVAMTQGDHGRATALLEQALALHPGDGRTLSALGMASLQARRFAIAQASFARAVARMPAHIGSWHGLGWACLVQGDQAGAVEAFERALEVDRNFAESHGAVALVRMMAGRHGEAGHHLDIADRLDPGNVTARYARALASGELRQAGALQALARRLLDRPGFFGGGLADEMPAPR